MPLRPPRRALLAGLAALPALAGAQEAGQGASQGTGQGPAWPNRPLRLVVGFAPGASADFFARTMAPRLEARLGQPVVVENRPGAGGNIGVDALAKAAPDGHTIGLGAAGALTVNPILQRSMPYDVGRDIAPVALALDIPFALVARPGLPATLAEVVALARAEPQRFAIAHGGNGTGMHLAAALFLQMAGLAMPAVPFRGSAPAATAVVAGDVALGVVDIPASAALIGAGRLHALAVSGTTRVPALAGVPTMEQAGIAGYDSVGWFGVIAPAGTAPPIIARLAALLREELAAPDMAARVQSVGALPHWMGPEEFAAFIRSETAKNEAVIRRAGIRVE